MIPNLRHQQSEPDYARVADQFDRMAQAIRALGNRKGAARLRVYALHMREDIARPDGPRGPVRRGDYSAAARTA